MGLFRCSNCGAPGSSCNNQCYYGECQYCGKRTCNAICPDGMVAVAAQKAIYREEAKKEKAAPAYKLAERLKIMRERKKRI